ALTAALYASDQDSFWRLESKALTLRRQRALTLDQPFPQPPQSCDVGERNVARNGFQEAIGSQCLPLGFENCLDESAVDVASLQNTFTQRASCLFLLQPNKILRKL